MQTLIIKFKNDKELKLDYVKGIKFYVSELNNDNLLFVDSVLLNATFDVNDIKEYVLD